MPASKILYDNKDNTSPESNPIRLGRAVDFNEIKSVNNDNADLIDGLQASKADKEEVKSADFTAVNDGRYIVDATCVVTDPVAPAQGKGFEVFVRNGSCTIGGVAYAAGKLLKRVYHSGAWGTVDITAGGVPEAPADDYLYARFNNSWVPISSVLELNTNFTFTAVDNSSAVFTTAALNLTLNNLSFGFKAIVRNKGAHTTTLVAGGGITINGGTTIVGDNTAALLIQRSATIWEVIPIGSGSGGSGVDVEDEGTPIVSATTLNFVGSGVTVTDVSGVATVTIPGGGSYVGPTGTKQTPTIISNVLTLDLASGANNVFAVASFNANITTLTISNPPAAGTTCKFKLQLTADGTARTITWPASVKWSFGVTPTLTSVSTKIDEFEFHTHDGGTTYFASIIGQAY